MTKTIYIPAPSVEFADYLKRLFDSFEASGRKVPPDYTEWVKLLNEALSSKETVLIEILATEDIDKFFEREF